MSLVLSESRGGTGRGRGKGGKERMLTTPMPVLSDSDSQSQGETDQERGKGGNEQICMTRMLVLSESQSQSNGGEDKGGKDQVHIPDQNYLKNHYYQQHLCEDVWVHILRSLPVKDLNRCKCVSKYWSRLISDVCNLRIMPPQTVSGLFFLAAKMPPFYYQFNWQGNVNKLLYHKVGRFSCSFFTELPTNFLVMNFASLANTRLLPPPPHNNNANAAAGESSSSGGLELESITFEGMSYLDVLPFSPQGKDFIDCCDGLLLFIFSPACQYFVCNPATRQYVSIPSLDACACGEDTSSTSSSNCFTCAALAYNPLASPHFKVVRFHLESRPQWLDVFDSKTGEWFRLTVQVEAPGPNGQFRFFNRPVYLDGVLYMFSWYYKIYSFDLNNLGKGNVTICSINMPINEWTFYRGCLGLSTGTLCYVHHWGVGLQLWLLDNPQCQCQDGHQWILKYDINVLRNHLFSRVTPNFRRGPHENFWIQPFAVEPNSDVIYLASECLVWRYNIKTDTLELLYEVTSGTLVPGILYHAFPYTRSLVPLKKHLD